MFNILVKTTPEQKNFLAEVRMAMEQYFGEDQRRIDHALQVSVYAENLLAYIDADPVLTLTAAYLHDIGIHEAESKHGSSSGKWQELEGPPIAREILGNLGADDPLIDLVAEIVGNHHTAAAVDSPEFRILWDADAMVNFAEVLPNKTEQQIEDILQNHMVTEAGFRIARKLFLKDIENHKQWPTDD
ncbi:MAG: HD domain-containing protein [Desulfuromonadales bacterium]